MEFHTSIPETFSQSSPTLSDNSLESIKGVCRYLNGSTGIHECVSLASSSSCHLHPLICLLSISTWGCLQAALLSATEDKTNKRKTSKSALYRFNLYFCADCCCERDYGTNVLIKTPSLWICKTNQALTAL